MASYHITLKKSRKTFFVHKSHKEHLEELPVWLCMTMLFSSRTVDFTQQEAETSLTMIWTSCKTARANQIGVFLVLRGYI